ncbi:MAG: hypothetical protein OEX02_12050, partial [Cyclobacteriaceae bacterium]|nr:hypothetical protein [Cyclobacteriaceae bacterium]
MRKFIIVGYVLSLIFTFTNKNVYGLDEKSIPKKKEGSLTTESKVNAIYDYITGPVQATGGTVFSGYFNSTNTGIEVVVPVPDYSFIGGTITIIAYRDGNSETLKSDVE